MSLTPYVHVDTPLGDGEVDTRLVLSADDRHHLTRVLRLRPGAAVELADGLGTSAPAVLEGDGVRVTGPPVTEPVPSSRLTVAQALGKGRKLDEVVRGVTELGADAVLAVAAERSITRLDERRAASALERWRAVARAACEQSRRPTRPTIEAPMPTAALAERDGWLLVAHPGGRPLPDVVAGSVGPDVAAGPPGQPITVTVAVGPEGGFTDAEVAALRAGGGVEVGLGPTVLRTEHAAAAAVAVLAASLGRWGARSAP